MQVFVGRNPLFAEPQSCEAIDEKSRNCIIFYPCHVKVSRIVYLGIPYFVRDLVLCKSYPVQARTKKKNKDWIRTYKNTKYQDKKVLRKCI